MSRPDWPADASDKSEAAVLLHGSGFTRASAVVTRARSPRGERLAQSAARSHAKIHFVRMLRDSDSVVLSSDTPTRRTERTRPHSRLGQKSGRQASNLRASRYSNSAHRQTSAGPAPRSNTRDLAKPAAAHDRRRPARRQKSPSLGKNFRSNDAIVANVDQGEKIKLRHAVHLARPSFASRSRASSGANTA